MSLLDQSLPAIWQLTQDEKGMTGQISYLVSDALIFHAELPVPGDPWPGPPAVLPFLACVKAEWSGEECDQARATYFYSTDRKLGDEFVEVSMSYGIETIDMTAGWEWETAGTPVQIDVPTVLPVCEICLTMKCPISPGAAINEAQDCVNSRTFRGWEPGTLRFDGADTDESYDIDGNLLSVRTNYRFTGKPYSHNYVWRPPLQDRDASGNTLFWQDKDNALATYTVDAKLVGTPVYVSGTAGTGAWDKPMNGALYRYDECDFAIVLGLPELPGDI